MKKRKFSIETILGIGVSIILLCFLGITMLQRCARRAIDENMGKVYAPNLKKE